MTNQDLKCICIFQTCISFLLLSCMYKLGAVNNLDGKEYITTEMPFLMLNILKKIMKKRKTKTTTTKKPNSLLQAASIEIHNTVEIKKNNKLSYYFLKLSQQH